jgi:hypothetical protein
MVFGGASCPAFTIGTNGRARIRQIISVVTGSIAIIYLDSNGVIPQRGWEVLMFFVLGLLLQFVYMNRACRDVAKINFPKSFWIHVRVIWVSYCANCISILLVMLPLLALVIRLEQNMGLRANGLTFLLLSGVIVMGIPVHALISSMFSVVNIKVVLALYFFLFATATSLYPGVSFLGGETLRFLGLGGGLPVEIVLKSSAENKTGNAPSTGRLILSTGTQIFVCQEQDAQACSPKPKFFLPYKATHHPFVSVYERSDILRTRILDEPNSASSIKEQTTGGR